MPRTLTVAGLILPLLIPAAQAARPFVELGPADGIALDQPRVNVEFIDSEGNSLGPDTAASFLLDTGAERILVAGSALSELESNGYQTDGQIVEQGVSGFTTFDVSKPYRLDFAGTSGDVVTLEGVRALSNAESNFGSFGGIVGMPGMAGRVASFDLTGLGSGEFLGVALTETLPASDGHRYTIPLQIVDFPIAEPDPPTTASGIPFFTTIVQAPTRKRRGRFLFDTGAQASIISEHLAFRLGLDADGDGNFDNEAVTTVPIGGVGGTIDAPVLEIGNIAVPTAHGTDLIWTEVKAVVLEIHPKIDGVFGSELLTSGWLETFLGGDDGYLQHMHCDFLDEAQHRGTLVFDVTAALNTPAPGLPPTDLDGDFIDDDWELLFFDDFDAPPGDSDCDQLSLLLEHALNTDPTISDPSPLAISSNPDGSVTLSFPRNRHLHFIELIVERSPSLAPGSWVKATPSNTSTYLFDALTEAVTMTFTPGDNYFRLRALPLPSP